MALIQVTVIAGVFTTPQKEEIIERLTDAMVAIEGENMRRTIWCIVEEVASGDVGRRRPDAHRGRRQSARPSLGLSPMRTPMSLRSQGFDRRAASTPEEQCAPAGRHPARARPRPPGGSHRSALPRGVGAVRIPTRRRGSRAGDIRERAQAPPAAARQQRNRLPDASAEKHPRKPIPCRRATTRNAPAVRRRRDGARRHKHRGARNHAGNREHPPAIQRRGHSGRPPRPFLPRGRPLVAHPRGDHHDTPSPRTTARRAPADELLRDTASAA